MSENKLSYLDDKARLAIYETILNGCQHLYSKGKLQKDKMLVVLNKLMTLSEEDPLFMAHLTSYAVTKLDSKDLKLLTVFANSLNDADGTPFSPGSKYKKPNLRSVSQAAIHTQGFDAKMIERLIEIANIKTPLGKRYREGSHFPRSLKTAIRKYLKYREQNIKILEGVKKVGLGNRYKNIYRAVHAAPSLEAATILRWPQKVGEKIGKKNFFDFSGLSDIEIAEKIRADKLPPTGVMGALKKEMSPVVAAAILEQASGDQAVILRETFDSQGLLKNKEVLKIFKKKIETAKTALDRVERLNTEIDADVEKVLKEAKSKRRKEIVGDIGKVFSPYRYLRFYEYRYRIC